MRIVNQIGSIDLLYDLVIMSLEDNCILAYVVGEQNGGKFIMAEYSTPEKANAEMNRLHRVYDMMNASVFQFRADTEVA